MVGFFFSALLLQEEIEIKLPDYSGIRGHVEAYEAAEKAFKEGRIEAALNKVREILRNPTGREDHTIVVTRLKRVARQWVEFERHRYYPFQLGAQCLQELARTETDRDGKIELLEEAKRFALRSPAPSTRRILRSIERDLEAAKRLPGEDPQAGLIRRIKKLIEVEDFEGAAALLREQGGTLDADMRKTLEEDLEKTRHRRRAQYVAAAESALNNLDPDREIRKIGRELEGLVPERDRLGPLGPTLSWIRDLAALLRRFEASGTLDRIETPEFMAGLQNLQKRAAEQGALVPARTALRLRAYVYGARLRAVGEEARKAPMEKLHKYSQAADGILQILKDERADLKRQLEEEPPRGRKVFLEELVEAYDVLLRSLESRRKESFPVAAEKLERIRRELAEGSISVLGDDSGGSFDPLAEEIEMALRSAPAKRWHPGYLVLGRRLVATLRALEGFRLGKRPDQIIESCRPYVDEQFAAPFPVPEKVLDVLNRAR